MNASRAQENSFAHVVRPAERWALFFGRAFLVIVPYFAVQHVHLFPPAVMPLTPIDRLVPFFQPAIYAYISLYAMVTLPLLLVRDQRTMRQMALGFAWLGCVSNLLFLIWPTSISIAVTGTQITDPLFRLVLGADTILNACPSLHASLAIYCALCSARLLKSRNQRAAVWLWTFLILLATLLAKRHVALDLFAGASLALAVYAVLFRAPLRDTSGSVALQATLSVRASLARGHEEEIAALTAHDARKRAAEWLCFVALGAFGMWLTITNLAAPRWIFITPGIIATALALNAFVLLVHDGMHGLLFASRRANWAASVLLGSTFLMSFSAYRVLHTRHHMFLGDPRDPDDYNNYTGRRSLVWSLHFLRLSVGSLLYLVAIPILAIKHGTGEERRRILVEYAFLAAVYSIALRFAPVPYLALGWFIPLLIVGTLTAIRGFTQHGITDASDPYTASRTILPNPVVGFFLLHENYHLEHHLFPEVPSYHLPRLHRLVWCKLPRAVSGRSYLGFLVRFFQATPRMDESPIGLEHPSAESS